MCVSAEAILNEVLNAFDFEAPVIGVSRYGCGHVNDTFCVHTQPEDDACRCFILQRISAVAFKNPEQLMSNIINVTEYLGSKIVEAGGDRSRETLQIIRPKNGALFYADSCGGAWRVSPFIKDTCCYQAVKSAPLFAAAGRAFGHFLRMMDGYPVVSLHETIPQFHDTENRLERLKDAIRLDVMGRVKDCTEEILFVMERQADCSVALQAQREGKLPLRVTHNDTKLNNVLFDKATGEGICVIDLDTVMPGLSINDFGDAIRFGANHCAEDETDLSRVYMDLDLYAAYTEAFLEAAGGTLTDAEVSYLPWGAKLMTLEVGIRFLTDYLMGDVYFHTSREAHNLIRCRTQFKLVLDMETHWDEMCAIVDRFRCGKQKKQEPQ